MNDFLIKDNYLVLGKSVKTSKKVNEKGEYTQYYTISLYSKKEDAFEKLLIFDKSIFDKYDIMKNYDIEIRVSFYKDKFNNDKRKLSIL
jgi:hypothetical protein